MPDDPSVENIPSKRQSRLPDIIIGKNHLIVMIKTAAGKNLGKGSGFDAFGIGMVSIGQISQTLDFRTVFQGAADQGIIVLARSDVGRKCGVQIV